MAIIVPAGIGGGHFSQGIPVLEDFMERMGQHYNLTVYSLHPVNKQYFPEGYMLKSLPLNGQAPSWKKAAFFLTMFFKDYVKHRFSLVHGFWAFPAGDMTVKLGRLLKIPSIVSLQGGEAANVPAINYGNMLPGTKKRKAIHVCRKAGVLTALTQYQSGEMKKHGVKRAIKIIPYGVDTNLFKYSEKEWQPPFNFVHVANLNEVKDQETLLKAFDIIRGQVDCSLTIIGPDYLNQAVQAQAKDLALNGHVKFLGAVPHKKLPDYFREAHIMLHTSLYESQAVVIAEAMASGTLVCGTHVGLMADLSGKACITVPVRDYLSLAREVVSLINDKDKSARLKKEAYTWTTKHNAQWTADKYIGLYEELMATKNAKL